MQKMREDGGGNLSGETRRGRETDCRENERERRRMGDGEKGRGVKMTG